MIVLTLFGGHFEIGCGQGSDWNRYGIMSETEPTTFSYKSTKRLIQLVQARRCLWDRTSSDYKDRLARDHAWSEIFAELDPAYKTANGTLRHEISISITKKWYNIRDSYVKSMKPGYIGRRNRPYIHSDLLRFLDDSYLDKLRQSLKTDHEEKVEDNETEPWDHEVFVSIDESEENIPNKRLKLEYADDSLKDEAVKVKDDEDIVSVLSNLIQKEEDEDRAFFKSITPAVKKLTEDSKFAFRIEVMKLIKALRIKDRSKLNLKSERTSINESGSE